MTLSARQILAGLVALAVAARLLVPLPLAVRLALLIPWAVLGWSLGSGLWDRNPTITIGRRTIPRARAEYKETCDE